LRYEYAGGQWWDVDKTSSKPVQQRINLYEQELKKRTF